MKQNLLDIIEQGIKCGGSCLDPKCNIHLPKQKALHALNELRKNLEILRNEVDVEKYFKDLDDNNWEEIIWQKILELK